MRLATLPYFPLVLLLFLVLHLVISKSLVFLNGLDTQDNLVLDEFPYSFRQLILRRLTQTFNIPRVPFNWQEYSERSSVNEADRIQLSY
jgi:hypothetical protein